MNEQKIFVRNTEQSQLMYQSFQFYLKLYTYAFKYLQSKLVHAFFKLLNFDLWKQIATASHKNE